MHHYRWNLLPPVPAKHSVTALGVSPLLAQLLYNRGISEPSQAELFMAADENLLGDPWLLPDMQQAVARIYQALLSGESMAVYGDFDADGITGTVLMTRGLSELGAEVTPYIPHRLKEGHGLNTSALKQLKQAGVSLVITVDCGVTGVNQVRQAAGNGLDIVITDHHTPLDELPPALAVVDPKRADSDYPFPELAGVGVAFKLLQALYQGMPKERRLDEMLDLVALGTVADMMPLLGENRYLVKQGLGLMNSSPRPGVRETAVLAGLSIGGLDADDISWVLAPRLNAAGRLEHAMAGYRLLATDSSEEARELATSLGEQNAERQRLTTKALAKAREQVLARGISPILIAGDRDYPGGIIGPIAGKLVDEFYRPSVVIHIGDEFCVGSCRSIPEFDIMLAISQCRGFLTRFGGHSQAAGFTLPTGNLPRLEQQLSQLAASQLAGLDLHPRLDIDAEVGLSELAGDTFQAIQLLAPFGRGNPLPAFLTREAEVADCRTMGSKGEHLRLKLRQDGITWDAVAFGMGDCLTGVHSAIDIVYNLEMDRWCGEERLRLNILDLVPKSQV